MFQSTNQLVEMAKKIAVPASIAAAFAWERRSSPPWQVQAASAIDDNSVAAITSLDSAMEAVRRG